MMRVSREQKPSPAPPEHRNLPTYLGTLLTAAAVFFLTMGQAGPGGATCALYPDPTGFFRGALGSVNRPWAVPGERVTITLRTEAQSLPDFGADPFAAGDKLTLVFTPTDTGAVTRVDVTELLPMLSSSAGESTALSFNFPDTSAMLPVPGSGLPLAGPVRIVVWRAPTPTSELPTSVDEADEPCVNTVRAAGSGYRPPIDADESRVVACIDALYQPGILSWEPSQVMGLFPGFVALPHANDYAGIQEDTVDEIHATTDVDGNLLMPVDWSGVILEADGVPVPVLLDGRTALRAFSGDATPISLPDTGFVGSYTTAGVRLPTLFDVQTGSPTGGTEEVFFGSTDASRSVLRFSRRSPTFMECDDDTRRPCKEASDCDRTPCTVDDDCANGQCEASGYCSTTCAVLQCFDSPDDPVEPETTCSYEAACDGDEECGKGLFEFRQDQVMGRGPVVIDRAATGTSGPGGSAHWPTADAVSTGGVCSEDPETACEVDDDGCTCVSFRIQTLPPVPLDGFFSSDTLTAFALREILVGVDFNGDTDNSDTIVVLRNRETGAKLRMPSPGCGIPDDDYAIGRPVIRVHEPPFSYPAASAWDQTSGGASWMAMLESEVATNSATTLAPCDISGNGSLADAVVRLFGHEGDEVAIDTAAWAFPSATLVADSRPLIDGRALAGTDTRLFVRVPEAGLAAVTTTRASVSSAGDQADFPVRGSPALTGDGAYVVFASPATNLVLGDDVTTCDNATNTTGSDNCRDVFVYDRASGITTLASRYSSGDPAGAMSSLYTDDDTPAVAHDAGEITVAFSNPAALAGDGGGDWDIYVREVLGGTTEHISVASGGGPNDGPSYEPALSGDALQVAFVSEATTLDAALGAPEVFVRDRTSGTTTLGAALGAPEVFVRNRTSGTTTQITTGGGGTSSRRPALSPNGRWLAFDSDAKLVGDDSDGQRDVYRYDLDLDEVIRISAKSNGGNPDGASGWATVADDGSVAFESEATDLVGGDINGATDVFVYDGTTDNLEIITRSYANLYEANGASGRPSLSGDGRYVAFRSDATNLIEDDANAASDVFVHDRLTRHTWRVHLGAARAEADGDAQGSPSVAGDGRTVAFTSKAENLISDDSNFFADVFVRAPQSGSSADINGDGDLSDVFLAEVETGDGSLDMIEPAEQVSVANGRAAFVHADDNMLYLWNSAGDLVDLGAEGNAVSLSQAWLVAQILDPPNDPLAKVRPADGTGTWTDTAVRAQKVAARGAFVAILSTDGTLYAYRPADSTLESIGAASDFVLSEELLAYDTLESQLTGSSCDEVGNRDDDCDDRVIGLFDLTQWSDVSIRDDEEEEERRWTTFPCAEEQCDPREPYRITGRTLRFLTLESDEGPGLDLDGNNETSDLVLQTATVDSEGNAQSSVLGTIDNSGCESSNAGCASPLASASLDATSASANFVSKGVCREVLLPLVDGCPDGSTYDPKQNLCVRNYGPCRNDDDCPIGGVVTCDLTVSTLITIGDLDGDGLPDSVDNCDEDENLDQLDTDGDGVGDACDPQTCGDGGLQIGEECDDGNDDALDGCGQCSVEAGWTCSGDLGETSVCSSICGDGILASDEICDDGADNGTATSCCTISCTAAPNGQACSDGELCSTGDSCLNGICEPSGCNEGATCDFCGSTCSVIDAVCTCSF